MRPLLGVLILIFTHLSALTWEEIEEEHQNRMGLVRSLFVSSMEEVDLKEAAILVIGSYSYGIAMADSDMDFALLIPEEEPSRYLPLLETFFKKCTLENLDWDKNGWHPPISQMPASKDTLSLIATPTQLARLRANSENTTLQYALYNAQYLAGHSSLHKLYLDAQLLFPNSFKRVISVELAKTKKAVERTRLYTKVLKKNLAGRLARLPSSELPIEIKNYWSKPIIELLQYLCMAQGIFPRNVKESIEILVEKRILCTDLADRVLDFLLFLIDLRSRLGKSSTSRLLSDWELEQIIEGYSVLEQLAQIR